MGQLRHEIAKQNCKNDQPKHLTFGSSFDTLLGNGGGTAVNSEKLFVVLAFSGGGVRASAFSFGVLEKLRDTTIVVDGDRRHLLDEVDMIVSNSGGSYTSGYFAAYRESAFGSGPQSFNERFLYADFESDVTKAILPNLLRLAAPGFNRSDLAAEVLDETLFQGKRFQDLISWQRDTPPPLPETESEDSDPEAEA